VNGVREFSEIQLARLKVSFQLEVIQKENILETHQDCQNPKF
jgi:hypothetical protein